MPVCPGPYCEEPKLELYTVSDGWGLAAAAGALHTRAPRLAPTTLAPPACPARGASQLPGCSHCRQVKERLVKEDIPFKEFEVQDKKGKHGDIPMATVASRIRATKAPDQGMPEGAPYFFFNGNFLGGGEYESIAVQLHKRDQGDSYSAGSQGGKRKRKRKGKKRKRKKKKKSEL